MKENKYNDSVFFDKYSNMERSKKGLDGAGEWNSFEKLLPDFSGKKVLDLGCGFGWHCEYAAEHGATDVTGVDISVKMLEKAKKGPNADKITYICSPIEDVDFKTGSYDVVLSSLAFHYIASFGAVCEKVASLLKKGGTFVFSAEHPVFTAYGSQDWYYNNDGTILHFPVDNYYVEGKRNANFLGEKVVKYHKTMTTYLSSLLESGFEITGFVEPQPTEEMLKKYPEMSDEMRRPMMFIVSSMKK